MRTLSNFSPFPLAVLLLLGASGQSAAQSKPTPLPPKDIAPDHDVLATPLNSQPAADPSRELLGQGLSAAAWFGTPIAFTGDESQPRDKVHDRVLAVEPDPSSLRQYLEQQNRVFTQAMPLLSPKTLSVESVLDTSILAQSDGLDPETLEPETNEQPNADDATPAPGFLSGSLTLTSNYIGRGISQTRSRPAVQGVVQYNQPVADDLTLYAGVLGTNIDFGRNNAPNIETDWYVGAHYQISDRLSAGLIGYYFAYLGNSDGFRYNFWEIFPSLTYDFDAFSVTGELGYSPNWLFETGDSLYLEALVTVPITENVFVSTTFVRQAIEENTRFGLPDWNTWNIALNYTRDNYTLSLKFSDSDVAKADCQGGEDICDPAVVLSLTRSW
ncbi:MAG: TorF family putative porin [Cyanobacteria bacterium P01_G01_bin.54]